MQKSRREIDLENYELKLELKKSLAREIGAKVSKEQFIFFVLLGIALYNFNDTIIILVIGFFVGCPLYVYRWEKLEQKILDIHNSRDI